MDIRDWQDGDDLKLLELFGDPLTAQHHHDRTMLGASTQQPFGVGLVAVDDAVPVAAGAIRTQAFHPQRMWCYIETAPLQRQRGIATALFNQLVERAPDNTAFKTRSVTSDETTAAWLTNRGFSPIQHSQRVVVASQAFEQTDIAVQELATGSVELSKVVAEYYNAIHDWDPSELTITQAQQLLLAPQTGAEQAFVTRDDHGISAFAIAYPGPIDNVVDLLIGHNPAHANPTPYVHSLLAVAGAQRSLAIEIDNSTTVVNALLKSAVAADAVLIEHDATIWATDA
ncbi:MAG: GNAT family N-acetyltransferase [Micrococcaceae bacterium]|nr:GNAT family N-acetyltransferase [Micrococcaceae bacterium]